MESGGALADFWAATPRDLAILRDAYLRARAWLAWHTGLVARGAVTRFDDLLPRALAPVSDAERSAARERRNAHNFKLWCAVFEAKEKEG